MPLKKQKPEELNEPRSTRSSEAAHSNIPPFDGFKAKFHDPALARELEKKRKKTNNQSTDKQTEAPELRRDDDPKYKHPTTKPGLVALRHFSQLSGLPEDTPALLSHAREVDQAHLEDLKKSHGSRPPLYATMPEVPEGSRGPERADIDMLKRIASQPLEGLTIEQRKERRKAQKALSVIKHRASKRHQPEH